MEPQCPHPETATSSHSAVSLVSRMPACLPSCTPAWLAGRGRGLPEMTPGQATDGNPKIQATQMMAAFMPAGTSNLLSSPHILAATPTPPSRTEGAFSHPGGNPKSASGGCGLAITGRGGQGDRERGGERTAGQRPLWLVWYLLSATALNTVGL